MRITNDCVQAVKLLECLQVRGRQCGSSRRDHLNMLNTMINLSESLQVCALGALVSILLKVNQGPCRTD